MPGVCHRYGFYGDRADDDADVFTGNPLPVEVQAQLRRRVDEFVGTGMWNDPIGSTIAEPLTIDSFTQSGKHRFQFTQKAHNAASAIRVAWLNYADKRRSAALRIQVRSPAPLAHSCSALSRVVSLVSVSCFVRLQRLILLCTAVAYYLCVC